MSGLDAERSEYGPLERPADAGVARLATRQHGVVASWQLHEIGIRASGIKRRVAAGRLHRIHRGVYAVGYRRLSPRGWWLAAVLACGPDAVLSHRAAIALWDLRPRVPGPVDVTVGRTRHSRQGIRVHSVRTLDEADIATRDGIPVTSLHRTLLDYAEVARTQQLRLALEEAERRALLDGRALHALMARSPGRRGHRPLRAALSEISDPPWTQSELERRLLALIRGCGIPEPHCNVVVAGHLVDFHWPAQRLVVEVDGYAFHRSRTAFERDRERDAALQLAGLRVLRVTHRRVSQPQPLIAQLRALLAGASGP
jgi:very-short-patch-repair endonuclease